MKHIVWQKVIENKFNHLLSVLVLLFVFSPFVESVQALVPIMSLFFFGAIIFTLRALESKKWVMSICAVIGLVAFSLGFVFGTETAPFPHQIIALIVLFVYSLFMIISIVLIVGKIFSAKKVTQDTVIGGMCIYMLIGYLYACVYYIIYYFDQHAFVFPAARTGIYMFYYSFTTLTTVGYGDVYPVNRLAMVFSNLEALTGQFYIGIFIARLVGLHMMHQYGGERQKN